MRINSKNQLTQLNNLSTVLSLLSIVVLSSMLSTGCAKKNKSFENADNIIEADTATLNDGATANIESIDNVDTINPSQDQSFGESAQVPSNDTAPNASIDTPLDTTTQDTQVDNFTTQNEQTSIDNSLSENSVYKTYVVQKNDTLMKIAYRVYGSIFKWKKLFELNQDKLNDPNSLMPGVQLVYTETVASADQSTKGDPYLIKKGDTLKKISVAVYGIQSKWKNIWHNNENLIKDPNKIYAGFYIYYQRMEEGRNTAQSSEGELYNMPSNEDQLPVE